MLTDLTEMRGLIWWPRHHDTDHRAIVATFCAGLLRKFSMYRKRRERFPVRLPQNRPRTEGGALFEGL